MKKLMIIGALVLAGCSDPVKDAQRELEIVEGAGSTNQQVCVAKKKVADAYLAAKNPKGFESARLSADIVCLLAQFSPADPYPPPPATDGV